jgi:hypothetical protein
VRSVQLGKVAEGTGQRLVHCSYLLVVIACATVAETVATAESTRPGDAGKVAAIQIGELQGICMKLNLR